MTLLAQMYPSPDSRFQTTRLNRMQRLQFVRLLEIEYHTNLRAKISLFSRWLTMPEFLQADLGEQLGRTSLITAVRFPHCVPGYTYWSHKVCLV